MGVLALAIAGCTGGQDTSSTDLWENSPLNKYLGWDSASQQSSEEQEREFIEQRNRVEELVAACMKDEGFEYVPVDYAQEAGMVVSSEDEEYPWEPDKREWVAKYGYGAVDWPGKEEMEEEAANPEEGESSVDPNQEYVESLSPSEQTAYYETLYGPQPTEEEVESGDYEYDPENAGCMGDAELEFGAEDPWAAEEFQPIMEAMTELYTTVREAPEFRELDAKWSRCMEDAGFDFSAQGEAQQSIYDRQSEIYESVTEEEWAEGEPDLPELDELQADEVELALADLECREKTDYTENSMKLQYAAEEAFIQEHKAELDALKEAFAASGGGGGRG